MIRQYRWVLLMYAVAVSSLSGLGSGWLSFWPWSWVWSKFAWMRSPSGLYTHDDRSIWCGRKMMQFQRRTVDIRELDGVKRPFRRKAIFLPKTIESTKIPNECKQSRKEDKLPKRRLGRLMQVNQLQTHRRISLCTQTVSKWYITILVVWLSVAPWFRVVLVDFWLALAKRSRSIFPTSPPTSNTDIHHTRQQGLERLHTSETAKDRVIA